MNDGTRLLNLLGVEEDEKFTTKITCNTYRVHHGLLQYEDSPEIWLTATCATLCQLINEPSFVIHKPRFSDEETTFLRLLHKCGKVTQLGRRKDGHGWAKISGFSALIDTADAILKPGEMVNLDEMFGEEND